MESHDNPLIPLVFEHACKKDFKNTIKYVVENEDFVSQIKSSFSNSEKDEVKPAFILIYLLKKVISSDVLVKDSSIEHKVISTIINLLETTFLQFNFMSLKKYFTLISELKLLDLLKLITITCDRTYVFKKLNHYFPRWTPSYRADLEKKFSIENPKILDKVEESHAQCRKLILKLTVDNNYRTNYMSEQYTNDYNRIIKESKEYIKEIIEALLFSAGSSKLEMVKIMEDAESLNCDDFNVQLLLDYIVSDPSDESLIKFLEDSEPTTTSLASCLLPFDSMSEDEDSDSSESEYECSQSGSQSANSQENK